MAGSFTVAAPLARGWTLPDFGRSHDQKGCPARAGMDPLTTCENGMVLRLPRSRGDGPRSLGGSGQYHEAAPLARGWTPGDWQEIRNGRGCPARAGMDLEAEY